MHLGSQIRSNTFYSLLHGRPLLCSALSGQKGREGKWGWLVLIFEVASKRIVVEELGPSKIK